MYQTDFICTYKLHSSEDQPEMYRIQLLQAFDLVKWDNNEVNKRLALLFNDIGSHSNIKEIINKAKVSKCCESVITLVDSEAFTIFTTLFQFETFDLFHRCICDIYSRKNVDDIHRDMLLKAME